MPSVFYYKQFHKAVWINKTAVFFNYHHTKMYLHSTKDCQTELLSFNILPARKEEDDLKRFTLKMQSEEVKIPQNTVHAFEANYLLPSAA